MLEKIFAIKARGSSISKELLGGLVTFMTMAYIISVQPSIMSGLAPGWAPYGGEVFLSLMVATCLISALAGIFMAFAANYPVSLAPGMGMNVMFATMIGTVAATPQIALGVIFMSGLIFFILNLFRLRETIIGLIRPSQQSAVVVGIGLFILVIGVLNAFREMGRYNLLKWEFYFPFDLNIFMVFVINLLIIAFLMNFRVPGALFIGMICGAIIASIFGMLDIREVVSPVPSLAPTFMQIDFAGVLQLALVPYIIIFLYVDIFDSVATLIGVTRKANLMRPDGTIPKVKGALMADAFGTLGGSTLGISPVTAYIESSAGVVSGARTGLATITTSLLFIIAIFFTPLWQHLSANVVVGPVLIIVGILMISEIKKVEWRDWTEAVPAVLTVGMMVAMFSITNGLAASFISYPICKLLGGKGKDLTWLNWVMAVVSIGMLLLIHTTF